ncbi:MAG: hypothetical protein V9G19_07255 [Tetrasphaera sp.]
MANYELGERPVRLRRGRVTFEARIGEESVPVRLRTADPGAPIGGLWIPQSVGYLGMFNRDAKDLPREVTLSVAQASGSPFPTSPPLRVAASVGSDVIAWSVTGLGGMPACDVVTLTVADDWLEFARPAGILEEDVLTPKATRMAAAARHALGVASVPETQRAHVVVVVDASGSMKTARARDCLNEAVEALTGIHAMLGGKSKRLEWHLATAPQCSFDNAEALLVALDAMPYGLGCSLDLPSIASTTGNELTVVYLVSDDVPGRLADFVDVAMQARHLVVLANPSPAPPTVGPVDVTVWPAGPLDDARLPSLAKDLLRGCFDANSACGRAVST